MGDRIGNLSLLRYLNLAGKILGNISIDFLHVNFEPYWRLRSLRCGRCNWEFKFINWIGINMDSNSIGNSGGAAVGDSIGNLSLLCYLYLILKVIFVRKFEN